MIDAVNHVNTGYEVRAPTLGSQSPYLTTEYRRAADTLGGAGTYDRGSF